MPDADSGQEHWSRVRYRGPDHPVVDVFARTKLDVLERLCSGAHLPVPSSGETSSWTLDVGAGPGVFTGHLAARLGRVVAVDLHREMLGRNSAARRVLGDGLRLPFPDGSFDSVFAGNLLHHLDQPVACLRECARVLKPEGGVMLSVEPNALNPLMCLFGLLVREERRLVRYTPGHMRRMARGAGLAVAAQRVAGHIFQNTTPAWMLPLLRPLETWPWPLGGYQLTVLTRR